MNNFKKVLVTGGAGFIGSHFITKLLMEYDCEIFNIDKLNYASDLSSIEDANESESRHFHYKIDLTDFNKTSEIINFIEPDLIVNFAAESHVDRSLDNPTLFIENNIILTLNLLEASRLYFEKLSSKKKNNFLIHHISTDEVYGTLSDTGFFNEETRYDPRSPYSASKASSDHLISAWHHSYGIPIKITNCSNNYGPHQFPEKLIPLTIIKCLNNQKIPIYGDGLQVRDWLYVEDHVDAIIKVIENGSVGSNYCIGGFGEKNNLEVVKTICSYFDKLKPQNNKYFDLIEFVTDRRGHDRRYSIDSKLIQNDLNWKPKYDFEAGLLKTIKWYLNNSTWLINIMNKSGYKGERLGTND